MTDKNETSKDGKIDSGKDVGGAEGGPDAGGAGNILGAVQPSSEDGGKTERRHD